MSRSMSPSRRPPFQNAVIQEVRRWSVYTCPTHGLIDAFHVGVDQQCPVAVKGTGCTEDLVGPIVVEEQATS